MCLTISETCCLKLTENDLKAEFNFRPEEASIILTQKFLHLLQTHVDVHTRVVVVGEVTRISQAVDPFQQDEEDETPEFPQH